MACFSCSALDKSGIPHETIDKPKSKIEQLLVDPNFDPVFWLAPRGITLVWASYANQQDVSFSVVSIKTSNSFQIASLRIHLPSMGFPAPFIGHDYDTP